MSYTYQIQFGSSDYLALIPATDLTMEGEWEQDTMIWRERISELKITAASNSAVYTLLESWFEDVDTFETMIKVKVLKNLVEDSVHWFGIKWGKLNKHLMTYIVQPDPYDLWGQYYSGSKSIGLGRSVVGLNYSTYYNTGTTYPFIHAFTAHSTLKEAVLDIGSTQSGFPSSDIVSSFLWQSAYENSSDVGTYRVMPLDYVTGAQSYLAKAGILTGYNDSFTDLLEWLRLFRCYAFFDTNNKLRFEHISFFNARLTDNAVDFSSYVNDPDEEFTYMQETIPYLETLSMRADDDNTDEDFTEFDVTYSPLRNRTDTKTYDHQSQLYSYLTSYGSDAITDRMTLWSGLSNHTYAFFDIDMDSFASSDNLIDVGWNVGASDVICGSNDFKAEITVGYTLSANITSLTGECEVSIVDRSSSDVISNVVTISSSGVVSETLTASATAYDAYLLIEGTVSDTGHLEGWFTLVHSNTKMIIIPTVAGAFSDNPKTNGAMSIANIFDSWWQDDRLSRGATAGGDAYVFDGTAHNLRRETMTFYYSSVINPLYGFNDGTRVGKIEKWKRSLVTDFYEIDIIYQEDE